MALNNPYQRKVQQYRQASIETASPGQVILMLYDGALRFLAQTKEGFAMPPSTSRNETINNSIVRVLNIVAELQNSLDHSVEGDIAKTLDELYGFVYHHLTRVNINKDSSMLPNCEQVLKDLRDSWAEMLLAQDTQTPKISSLSQSA